MKRAIQSIFDCIVGRIPGGGWIAMFLVIAGGIVGLLAIWDGLDLLPIWVVKAVVLWLAVYACTAHHALSDRDKEASKGDRDDGWFKLVEKDGFFDEILLSRERLDKLRLHAFTSVGVVAKAKPAADVLNHLWAAMQVHKTRAAP